MLTALVAADPEVAGTRHRILRQRRCGVRVLVVGECQQVIEFLGVEAGQVQIEMASWSS